MDSLLVTRILNKIELACGKDCLKYIDKPRLTVDVIEKKKTLSTEQIFELMTSELIVFALSKKNNSNLHDDYEVSAMCSDSSLFDAQPLGAYGTTRPYDTMELPFEDYEVEDRTPHLSRHKRNQSYDANLNRHTSSNVRLDNDDPFNQNGSTNAINLGARPKSRRKTETINSSMKPEERRMKKKSNFHSNDLVVDEWVQGCHAQLCDIFPNMRQDELLERCAKLDRNDDEKFIDLLNDLLSEGVALNENFFSMTDSDESANNNDSVGIDLGKQLDLDAMVECGCCFEEYKRVMMFSCEAKSTHLFCCNCIKRYTDVEIGKGVYDFKCLTGFCTSTFPRSALINVIDSKCYDIMLQKRMEQEINSANITNLESCPFCPFSIEFEEKATVTSQHTTLRCDNPNCRKTSCRLCKKIDHRPAKCDENDLQKNTRNLLENEMTEAIISNDSPKKEGILQNIDWVSGIRTLTSYAPTIINLLSATGGKKKKTCYKCKKRFIIRDGCNKITCTCGAMMCYICKKPVTDYRHFHNGGCSLHTNSTALHNKEAKDRAEQIKKTLKTNSLLRDPSKEL